MSTSLDFAFIAFIVISRWWVVVTEAQDINATGGTFPYKVYQESTFSYHFIEANVAVSYLGDGSGTGKCNIMGFWHTGNVEATSISSTVKSTDQTLCSSTSRPFRQPLMDFAGSDSVLGAVDYANYPDLQMFPSVAGAVVPIFNIPELKSLPSSSASLTLSRSTLAGIFTGKIRYWGHSSIIQDVNKTSVVAAHKLSSLGSQPINVVVRQDSSGTSEIFTTALASFDPQSTSSSPDFSFGNLGTAGSTPTWCDPKTDEVQDITVSGCVLDSTSSEAIMLKVVVAKGGKVASIAFFCNDTVATLASYFTNASLPVYPVSKTVSGSTATFRIAYPYGGLTKVNWYQPAVVSTPSGITVIVSTVQEGGYLNAPYSGTVKTTSLVHSVWVLSNTTVQGNASWVAFTLEWKGSASGNFTAVINASSPLIDISAKIKSAINLKAPGAVSKVSRTSLKHSWAEYQVTFSSAAGSSDYFATLTANVTAVSGDLLEETDQAAFVVVTKLLDANNYPRFYDSSNPRGYSGSGR